MHVAQVDLEPLLFFHDADVRDRGADALGRIADVRQVHMAAYPGFEGLLDAQPKGWDKWDSAVDLAHYFRQGLLTDFVGRHVHLAGAGFGGWVALELALMAPQAYESLVLVAPYGVKLFDRMERDFADVLLLDANEQVELGWADSRRVVGLRMPGFPAELPDEQHEIAFAERAALARYIWKPFLHSRELSRWVESIVTPTLIIAGSHDKMLHEGHSRALADRMPNAHYVEIPDAGHYPYLEQPEAFEDAVLEFYQQLKEQS